MQATIEAAIIPALSGAFNLINRVREVLTRPSCWDRLRALNSSYCAVYGNSCEMGTSCSGAA
jgi:hypothetical protein